MKGGNSAALVRLVGGQFVGQFTQFGHDLGVLLGQVGGLAQVVFQVVKFLLRRTVVLPGVPVEMSLRQKVFPPAFANTRPVEVEGLPPLLRLAREEGGLVDSVDHPVGGGFEPTKLRESGHEVDGREHRIGLASRRDLARPAHDTGQAVPALIG